MKEIFSGIFRSGRDLFTKNLVPSRRVYGEKLVLHGREEYRLWIAERSKLAAAVINGMRQMPLKKGTKVLYLGAASGTTPSHVSDIVEKNGAVYAIEFSERPFRLLIDLAKDRQNIVPILADARKPEEYYWIEECDVLYADLAQPDMTDIAVRNFEEFIFHGSLLIAVKSQSIDVVKRPEDIYEQEKRKLEKAGFDVLELIDLEPYEEKHCLIVAKK